MTRKTYRNLFLVVLVAMSAAALGHALAQSRPVAEPPPQLVTGLPDFSRLVEKVGPAVVSIEATGSASKREPGRCRYLASRRMRRSRATLRPERAIE